MFTIKNFDEFISLYLQYNLKDITTKIRQQVNNTFVNVKNFIINEEFRGNFDFLEEEAYSQENIDLYKIEVKSKTTHSRMET